MDTIPTPLAPRDIPPMRWVAWGLMAAFLILTLAGGLLGTFVAGFAVYTCVHALAQHLPRRWDGALARKLTLLLLATIVGVVLASAGVWAADLLRGANSSAGLTPLLTKMGEIIAQIREILPHWMTQGWPSSAIALNTWLADFFKDNAGTVQTAGQDALKNLMHVVLGLMLGGLLAASQEVHAPAQAPLTQELRERMEHMVCVFRKVVFAQFKISLLNSFFTAIFLLVVLPMSGHPMPFAKTLVLITFVAGLIPVLGNLLSNTVITILALSVSLWVAAAALMFLVVIHKVEYFLNAKIVGTQIKASSWELLGAMLVMETLFGLPGVIAAPIYYAYIKRELVQLGWI